VQLAAISVHGTGHEIGLVGRSGLRTSWSCQAGARRTSVSIHLGGSGDEKQCCSDGVFQRTRKTRDPHCIFHRSAFHVVPSGVIKGACSEGHNKLYAGGCRLIHLVLKVALPPFSPPSRQLRSVPFSLSATDSWAYEVR
jgi:hypothetical protein